MATASEPPFPVVDRRAAPAHQGERAGLPVVQEDVDLVVPSSLARDQVGGPAEEGHEAAVSADRPARRTAGRRLWPPAGPAADQGRGPGQSVLEEDVEVLRWRRPGRPPGRARLAKTTNRPSRAGRSRADGSPMDELSPGRSGSRRETKARRPLGPDRRAKTSRPVASTMPLMRSPGGALAKAATPAVAADARGPPDCRSRCRCRSRRLTAQEDRRSASRSWRNTSRVNALSTWPAHQVAGLADERHEPAVPADDRLSEKRSPVVADEPAARLTSVVVRSHRRTGTRRGRRWRRPGPPPGWWRCSRRPPARPSPLNRAEPEPLFPLTLAAGRPSG